MGIGSNGDTRNTTTCVFITRQKQKVLYKMLSYPYNYRGGKHLFIDIAYLFRGIWYVAYKTRFEGLTTSRSESYLRLQRRVYR